MKLDENKKRSFAFVMNLKALDGADSYTVLDGYELRKASDEEVTLIREDIGRYNMHVPIWEYDLPCEGQKISRIQPQDWRYYVIAFDGSNETLADLETVFDICALEIEVGVTFLWNVTGNGGYGILRNPARSFHILDGALFNQKFFHKISGKDIDEIRRIFFRLSKKDPRLDYLKRLMNQLGQLKSLPHNSPLRFLGYFAILESLLTHIPRPSDPYDSITRQVKKKLSLLNNRFETPLDYSNFMGTEPETIWSKMYMYRSQIAHGGAPSFDRELAILKNHDTALDLIKTTVKAVIRQAIEEPQLINDLRGC